MPRVEVAPEGLILGHLNHSPDLVVQRRAAESGCRLSFDVPSRAHWRMPAAVRVLADAGYQHRLLLGGDTVAAASRPVDGGWTLYLLRGVRPRLALELGEELTDRVLTEHPGRVFAVERRSARERSASAAELVQVL